MDALQIIATVLTAITILISWRLGHQDTALAELQAFLYTIVWIAYYGLVWLIHELAIFIINLF
nr:hypothetical protein [uncultured Flavobacterium sp.]